MLECLRHKDLDNVIMIVVRYFGGTLLGTGGLVKAYQQSTLEAINNATLTLPVETGQYEITLPYDLISKAENLLQKEAIIIDRLYDEQITFIYQSETDLAPQFQEITNGQYAPVFQETLIVEKELVQEN